MHIQDKVVVITGGASGLGLATAHYLLHEKGARIALFDRDEAAGARAVQELGGGAAFIPTDVSSDESVGRSVDNVVTRFGAIHVTINAAAILSPGKVLDRSGHVLSMQRFREAVMVNLVGTFNVMSRCAEQMAKNPPEAGEERGVVINVSSIAAYEGQVGQCAYAASKAGLLGLNLPAARELGPVGIRVNAIAPGLFRTPMAASLDRKVFDALVAQAEAPSRMGDPSEFAHCCAFIIENAYLNGETIRLDAASRLRAR